MTPMLRHALLLRSVVFWLVVVNSAVELVLTAADLELVGSPHWRMTANRYGAFWAGLLHDWQPNYAAQPWTMFLSYAFLHSGPVHLIGNILALLILSRLLPDNTRAPAILVLWIGSAIGGALCFGLLASSPQPMVGASGALFGLAGAWQYTVWRACRRNGTNLRPVWFTLIWLVLLNLIMWLMMNGMMAWETHLGGFVTGWVLAVVQSRTKPAEPHWANLQEGEKRNR